MTRASLAAFRRTVTVAWPGATERNAREALIRAARSGHAEIMQSQTARSGVAPSFEAFANRRGRPVEAVILPGPIVYHYDYTREIVVTALRMLQDGSPVRSGAYRRSHMLFIDGMPASEIPLRFEPGADIMIANSVPYARRIEVGKTKSGRSFVMQVPDRLYERTAKVLAGRFGNVASIRMSYATLPGAWIIRGRLSASFGVFHESVRSTVRNKSWDSIPGFVKKDFVFQRRRRQGRDIGKPVQAPAIVIRAL